MTLCLDRMGRGERRQRRKEEEGRGDEGRTAEEIDIGVYVEGHDGIVSGGKEWQLLLVGLWRSKRCPLCVDLLVEVTVLRVQGGYSRGR